MQKRRHICCNILFILTILAGAFQISFYDYFMLPGRQLALQGEKVVSVRANPLIQTQVEGDPDVLTEEGAFAETGNYNVEYSFMGVVPLKTQEYQVIPELKVMVGGHSVGILLQTDGALVVGYAPLLGSDGESTSPAKAAGVEVGDFITEVDGEKVLTDEQVGEAANQAGIEGRPLPLTILRDGATYHLELTPSYCEDTQSYRVGLYIRDNTAGVGTLTFYEPESGAYGALGHMVGDNGPDGTAPESGSILGAEIQSIRAGAKGEPGEKVGVFVKNELNGTIEHNSVYGIFGHLEEGITNTIYPEAIPVATASQIEEGPAKIVTVLTGDTLEEFDIEIMKILPQQQPTGKGMIIKATDPRLLAATGGIVQGMSGSPIIQNGRLVGAVTHVFINDPTKGYGCLAEWMVLEDSMSIFGENGSNLSE